jgi:segregation and condensation protein B
MTDEQINDIVEETEAVAAEEVEVAEAAAEEKEMAPEGEEAAEYNVTPFPTGDDHAAQLRMIEALLFAAAEPLDIDSIAARLPEGADVGALIEDLQKMYAPRGVNLIRLANKWMFRTADDLTFLMEREAIQQRKLSRAAMETLAIIAYHQPVTRAEIEEIRGVSVSKGTLDVLMETGWVRLRGRRKVPGRPVTYGTTEEFMIHFGLENIGDLPGHEELRAAGLLEANLPPDFDVPTPSSEGGDGDGDFSEDEPEEEYGQALDEHLESAGEAEAAAKAG